MTYSPKTDFFREYDLAAARTARQSKSPAAHQAVALSKLAAWYDSPREQGHGGILVLPTGGGKTFTAARFLATHALSDGHKVLWLAHTHHLLEQAFASFEGVVGSIREPRSRLNVRLVSGTVGHLPAHTVKRSDDVVISSLQTVANAIERDHEQLTQFLSSSDGRLFVVFDEAHHSPAPTYRKLLVRLRERFPRMYLLGLTATPTYTEEKKRGWLLRLFPQGIIDQVSPKRLMADEILARPIFEDAPTAFIPEFSDREYDTWVGTNRDLPEDVIRYLAENRERNECIVNRYVNERSKYGKTIVFVDRWQQCEYLREQFARRGVKAEAIYSHVEPSGADVEARRRRTATDNAKSLEAFRKGEADVLINIRMATEGTDVPDAQTVFLTRQTTSQVLLTQMVGRALRGPKFGGTKSAYIVSFIDNWKHRINWATYDALSAAMADEGVRASGARPPLQLISIDLIARLARQMDSGTNVNAAPYLQLLPLGWYVVNFDARAQGSDDVEPISQLVMVYESEAAAFDDLMKMLRAADLSAFESEALRLPDVNAKIDEWVEKYFGTEERIGGGLREDIFNIARHFAQNDLQAPPFFSFERRADHDLDVVAKRLLDERLDRLAEDDALQREYQRQDRFWKTLYFTYEHFTSQYNGTVQRLLQARRSGVSPEEHRAPFITPESIPFREATEDIKEQVKSRDGNRCVCCGYSKRPSFLQVDHISPTYRGGGNDMDNLQTLCRDCNRIKATDTINFLAHRTLLSRAPLRLVELRLPQGENARIPTEWETFLRRTINFFYRCSAVDRIQIGERGDKLRQWTVRLFPGNDPAWIQPLVEALRRRIAEARDEAGYEPAPDRLSIS